MYYTFKFRIVGPKIFLILFSAIFLSHAQDQLSFIRLPDSPSHQPGVRQEGVAGAYAGISNNALIIAGGANFPNKKPWEGGKKAYYDDIYILQLDPLGDEHTWNDKTFKLPKRMAYGASLTLEQGVLCLGGNDQDSCLQGVYLIQWNNAEETLAIHNYPDLPVPLTSFAAAFLDNTVYVLGGTTDLKNGDSQRHFYRLDLSKEGTDQFHWQRLPPWPGPSRIFPLAVGQSNGIHNCIYLFSGRNISQKGEITVLYDGYEYDPFYNKWEILFRNDSLRFPVMAGTAFSSGVNSIVFLGGDDGQLMYRQLELKKQLRQAEQSKTIPGLMVVTELDQKLRRHQIEHPGFSRDILIFNTITSTLYKVGTLPFPSQVTTCAVPYRNGIIVPSGEIRPGVRTPSVQYVLIADSKRQFGWLNSMVMIIYLVILAWMGWYFSKRQKSTNDFFKGGGRVPWWAAGLSIFGTVLSAITFMAIPAKTYSSDWSYFMYNMGIVLVAPLIIILFVPYFRKQNVTTAYEFLEIRFNLATRLIGSLFFILFQIGRMAIVLLLPSIALSIVTGVNVIVCILIMGLVSMIYTSIGGIEAVVWTDVLQVIILLGGAILALVIISLDVSGGLIAIINQGIEQEKFNIFNVVFDLKKPVLWTVLIGSLFANLTTYGTDQTIVQRYLTVKSQRAAEKSVWTNALLSVPASLLFFMIGTALFVFYRHYPDQLSISLSEADAIFPWYIITQLPRGVSGLLISGIFAASMSSLSSSINSAATAYYNDFHQRFGWAGQIPALQIARWASIIVGLLGVLFAIFMATWDIKSLWDEFAKILGLVLGSLGGVFLLGILSKRANGMGALSGIIISAIVQYLVALYQPVHLLLYTATGVVSCFLSGWFISLLSVKGNVQDNN